MNESEERFDKFIQEFVPKFGPSILQMADGLRINALRDALIAKGLITREALDTWEIAAIEQLSDSLRKMPPLSDLTKN